MGEPRPHPENVPGDYFVEDGCCLTCAAPFSSAPDHFAWSLDAEGQPCHCYVKRQPHTPAEHERMFEAIRHAEADCINYQGQDRALQERLVEAGEGRNCVGLPDGLQRRSAEVLAELERRHFSAAKFWRRLRLWWRGKPAL